MKKTDKNQNIRPSIRDDYPFPFFQDLIIEILMATRQYHERALSGRLDAALKAILGEPARPHKKSDGHRDEEAAYQVLAIIDSMKTPKGKKVSLTKACEEVARKKILGNDYKMFGKLPKDIDHDTYKNIESRTTAIFRKVKNNQESLRKNYYSYHIEKMMFEETDHQEKKMILDVFESWKKRHLSRDKI